MKGKPITSICNRPLRLFLLATFLSIVSGCSTVERLEVPRAPMTLRQARKSLTESLSNVFRTKSLREVSFSRHKVIYKYESTYSPNAGQTYTGSITFAEMENLSVGGDIGSWGAATGDGISLRGVFEVTSNRKSWMFVGRAAAINFIDSLLTLKKASLAPDTEEADFAAFATSAKTWLATTPRTAMSDDARTYKVLAEDAFKRKDFAAALDAYRDALNKYPMWPEGHYNAALLAAEIEDYELATQHMRRYLVLAPDAKDVTAAKDQLLLWQLKAK